MNSLSTSYIACELDDSIQIVHIFCLPYIIMIHNYNYNCSVTCTAPTAVYCHEVSLATCQASLTKYTQLMELRARRSLTVWVVPGIQEVGQWEMTLARFGS